MWLEAQKLLRESLKVPQLSNNLAEGVDNYPSGSLSVFLMSEDKRGSVLPDGGGQLVKEPEIFLGSPDAVVDASELRTPILWSIRGLNCHSRISRYLM